MNKETLKAQLESHVSYLNGEGKKPSFQGADLQGADLRSADLRGTIFDGTKF